MYKKTQNPDIKFINEIIKAKYAIKLVLLLFGNLSKFKLLSNMSFFKIRPLISIKRY